MNALTDPRLTNFIEYVEETEPKDVFDAFVKEIRLCDDPANANLTMMLEKARNDSPQAKERAKIEHSMLQGALYHCNS